MQKIAIVTDFVDINYGYSLTGIVTDQIRMLEAHGHEVRLLVREKFNPAGADFDPNLIHAVVPDFTMTDYQSIRDVSEEHLKVVDRAREVFERELAWADVVFTHDFLFQGRALPYALALQQVQLDIPFLHWIHSIPSGHRDWWAIRDYPPNHKLVYPNKTDALRIAEQFRGLQENVVVIPHIKDLRSFHDFHEDTCKFIDEYPAVMQANIVEILPASQDRLEWKRVPEVIKIFGAFKRLLGLKVCLVIANQWAVQTTYKQSMDRYKDMARAAGLAPGEDFIFTSDFDYPRFEVGIPKRMIRELMQCANLFIFPTHHESFGLVVPEAALAGCFLLLNGDLMQQREVCPDAHFQRFGSYTCPTPYPDKAGWLEQVALVVLRRMQMNEAIMTRTHARQTYNWDALYMKYYLPIMAEAALWGKKAAA